MNMSTSHTVDVRRLEISRVFTSARTHPQTKTTHLSILDSTVARFSTTAATWFYQPGASTAAYPDPLSTEQLRMSLVQTINYYPWLTGQLHWAHSPVNPFAATSHEKRFRRLAITYSSPSTEPGAVLAIAACDSHALSELIPSQEKRIMGWKPTCTGWTLETFLPDLKSLALNQFPNVEGPCFAVQITKFKCGGTAIGIALSHPIADALAMTNFMHDWSRVNAAMVKSHEVPKLSPCFDPALLDARSSGDIDAQSPEQAIVSRARQLPLLRYDYWVNGKGETIVSSLPPELQDKRDLLPPHETAIPWESFDRNAPSSYRVLHFSQEEIENMYQAAITIESQGLIDQASKSSPSTRHDVLLAHVWQCINAARAPLFEADPEQKVLLTMTMGLRARLSLLSSFFGSPIMTTYVSRPASFLTNSVSFNDSNHHIEDAQTLAQIASDVHRTQFLFTPSAISDTLHDAAFEIDPNRLWQTMIGSLHTLSTSWIHTHVYDDMDFGSAGLLNHDGSVSSGVPSYVHPGVGEYDGLVVILEARPGSEATATDKWYHRGVDAGIALRDDVMERLVGGAMLRRWQKRSGI